MSAGRQDGFDVVVSEAWQRFESNLAAHVSSMPEGTYITITSAQASHGQRGQRPYVDLVSIDADLIVGVASLPSYLYPDSPDIVAADRRLHGLGWSEAGKPTADGTVMDFTVDGPRDEAGLLATTAVATFREVWNVPHPSFLSAWTVGFTDGGGSGPVALAHDPVPSSGALRADTLPTALRSLHTFCELVGRRVDRATVKSVCGEDDLVELRRAAHDQVAVCAARALEFEREGSRASAQVWEQQARSWAHTADSLRLALGSPPSVQDRPAKSAGS